MSIQEFHSESASLHDSSKIERIRGTSVSGPRHQPARRSWFRGLLHWIRRTHLYLGLFLFPWAVLYGVTGFLFNHPVVFSDQASHSFSQSDWAGTPLASPPSASSMAAEVVEALKQRSPEASNYRLVNSEQASFVRELASASVVAEGRKMTLFLDVLGRGGVIYSTPVKEAPVVEKPPFAIGKTTAGGKSKKMPKENAGDSKPEQNEKLVIAHSLPEIYQRSIPALLTKLGFPTGEVTVGSIPDLTFPLEADGRVWMASYNPLNGSVTGKTMETSGEPITVRRFLTKLHTAHGYPYSQGARWCWAVLVDLMSGVMVFWGVSGLLMWWQIKMTRQWGILALAASAVIASLLTVGMWHVLSNG